MPSVVRINHPPRLYPAAQPGNISRPPLGHGPAEAQAGMSWPSPPPRLRNVINHAICRVPSPSLSARSNAAALSQIHYPCPYVPFNGLALHKPCTRAA
ncbi:hypothetical protein COCCADRAFT_95738 [Bipolaris zeicola 26-R-13]|uniref:Uncharacterized protein n=1 Tax=Cochliobolus carbonum (strain 26-R-13) TaxID=930089 RepID=W6Y7T4_COCC2|nr:uncharacterized protein COCCADRAFT_95738 [Bipolaris zeicola 26-R-13]EUC33565.1 hypothetical protein COCCADRAFT_95738 [Bipolaris zeicola 26-R-13]